MFGPIGGGKDYDGARPLLRVDGSFQTLCSNPLIYSPRRGFGKTDQKIPATFHSFPTPESCPKAFSLAE